MSIISNTFAAVCALFTGFSNSHRYESLFAMSEIELAARGYDREKLVRGYITGFAYG